MIRRSTNSSLASHSRNRRPRSMRFSAPRCDLPSRDLEQGRCMRAMTIVLAGGLASVRSAPGTKPIAVMRCCIASRLHLKRKGSRITVRSRKGCVHAVRPSRISFDGWPIVLLACRFRTHGAGCCLIQVLRRGFHSTCVHDFDSAEQFLNSLHVTVFVDDLVFEHV